MVTVLVAHNEQATNKSLVKNILWDKLQLTLMAEVSNGQEAVKCLENTPPDILIADVSTPTTSGLELAKYIYEKNLPTKVVLLSEYPNFAYAQQGIRYNVRCYMVKPYDKQSINEALKELVKVCIDEKKEALEKQRLETFLNESKPQLREKLWLDLLQGNITDEERLTQSCSLFDIQQTEKYAVVLMEVDGINENDAFLEEGQKVSIAQHLAEFFTAHLPTKEQTVVLPLAQERYVAVVAQSVESVDMASVCDAVRESFFGYTQLSATFGIGGSAVGLLQLKKAYTQAQEALLYKYVVGNNAVIRYEDIAAITACETPWINTQSIQAHIIRAVRCGDEALMQELCEQWLAILTKCHPTLAKSLLVQFVGNVTVDLASVGSSLAELFGDGNNVIETVLSFDTVFDAEHWLKQQLKYICSLIEEKSQKSATLLVRKAAHFIDIHFAEDINVDMVAKHVCVSSGYLMTIFKKQMGISMIAYLTEKRISMAKKLLLRSEHKIYEIAEMVGYSNATFFSSTFRNHVGMSPKRYKECYQADDSLRIPVVDSIKQ